MKDGHICPSGICMNIFDYPNRLQIANLVILINLYFERFHTVLEMGSKADWWVFLQIANSVLDLFLQHTD